MHFSNYRPIQFTLVFIAGLVIGKFCFVTSSNSVSFSLFNGKPSKLQSVINLIDNRYVDDVNLDSLTDIVIPDILRHLDPHSKYISSSDRNLQERKIVGEFCGVGLEFNLINDSVIALYTVPNGPSDKAGILPGDNLVSIDTVSVVGTDAKLLVSSLLRGGKGSKVTVSVKRPGVDSVLSCNVSRNSIALSSVPAAYMVDSVTGYVKVTSFSDVTYSQFLDKVQPLRKKGMKNLVLDLRDNGGGRVIAAKSIASEFLKTNDTIYYTLDHNRKMTVATDTIKKPKFSDINLVCIVNYNTASASELLVSSIQDHDRGLILGLRTFGKGLVQEPVILNDSSVVNLTTQRYYSPSGRCLQKDYKDYANDYSNRLKSGELFNDSAFDYEKCKVFHTVNGRNVYSGVGVRPDIFVPKKKVSTSDISYRLDTSYMCFKFAARKYNIMVQRDSSLKLNPEFVERLFADENSLLRSFVFFANSYDINISLRRNRKELSALQDIILNQIKAYAYHIIGDEDHYYKYINFNNPEIESAVQILADKSRYDGLLGRKD